jgi:hypothetical protein
MNKEIANKWAAALRSGKYEQTTQTLQDGEGFCCLGVLCKLAESNGVNITTNDGILEGNDLSDQNATVNWSDIQSCNGEFGHWDNLAELNDEEGYSFNQIADIIEKYYDEL